jgi:MoxR-like ATPase
LFESIEDVRQRLVGQEYVCDRRLATVVYLAVKLDKPVLIEGPAGVGKTELAKSL